jgi:hypothetical protein
MLGSAYEPKRDRSPRKHKRNELEAPPPPDEPVIKVRDCQGKVVLMTLDQRFKKYAARPCRIENMCGRFKYNVRKAPLSNVITLFPGANSTSERGGWTENIYSIYGNCSYLCETSERLHFKGCQGLASVHKLAEELRAPTKDTVVHMVVISGCMGEFVDVRPCGLMDTLLRRMKITPFRTIDATNSVRFHVRMDEWLDLPRPKVSDWTITTRGSVIIKFTWSALPWTLEVERKMLEFCNKQMDLLRELILEFQ